MEEKTEITKHDSAEELDILEELDLERKKNLEKNVGPDKPRSNSDTIDSARKPRKAAVSLDSLGEVGSKIIVIR